MKAVLSLAAVLLLGLLIGYTYEDHFDLFPAIADLQSRPEYYDGSEVGLSGIPHDLTSDSFLLTKGDSSILVRGVLAEAPRYGDVVLRGTYHKEGYVEAAVTQPQPYNLFKPLVSLFALPLLFFIFFREWRFRSGRFVPCRTG